MINTNPWRPVVADQSGRYLPCAFLGDFPTSSTLRTICLGKSPVLLAKVGPWERPVREINRFSLAVAWATRLIVSSPSMTVMAPAALMVAVEGAELAVLVHACGGRPYGLPLGPYEVGGIMTVGARRSHR